MKKTILILSAAFALVGCKQQGGTGDTYSTDQGTSSRSTPDTVTQTNYSTHLGSATSPSGTNTGTGTSSTSTNTEGSRQQNP